MSRARAGAYGPQQLGQRSPSEQIQIFGEGMIPQRQFRLDARLERIPVAFYPRLRALIDNHHGIQRAEFSLQPSGSDDQRNERHHQRQGDGDEKYPCLRKIDCRDARHNRCGEHHEPQVCDAAGSGGDLVSVVSKTLDASMVKAARVQHSSRGIPMRLRYHSARATSTRASL